ncbi:MAG TPA: thioredoxin domain-containing protein [Candidatus Paceibacterota bacterium]|nr:thioredoxin domain-containing protein [Candidatus Paceibacterota bacterium]
MKNKEIFVFCTSLILIGLVVSASIIYTRTYNKNPKKITISDNDQAYVIQPISSSDHMIGNPNADLILIEYSDFTCQFCREFHPTMMKLVIENAKNGSFAWVYRNFSADEAIGNKNSLSMKTAIMSECVNEIGGPTKFWNFLSDVYTQTPINFTESDVKKIVENSGINMSEFEKCISSGKFNDKIQRNIDDGLAIYEQDGDFGTPYNILITRDGRKLVLPGPQNYSLLDELIKLYRSPSL